jgi:uncharacterized protein YdhG (YjbR/CyaY superfamily)
MCHPQIDNYLAALPADQREALLKLREVIRSAAPTAEEAPSYGIPAFKLNGPLVSYGAAKQHCAFYVMSYEVMKAHAKELEGYDTSTSTIRFTPEKPLPQALVKKLVKARIAENAEIAAARAAKKKASKKTSSAKKKG